MKTMNSGALFRISILVASLILATVVIRHLFFKESQVSAVITAPVLQGDIEESVLAGGTIEAARLVSVGAQVSGRVERLAVAVGDAVKKGQLIAEIDSTIPQNALRTAAAALGAARAQKRSGQATLKQAELAYARQQELAGQDAASHADLETAEAALDVARSALAYQDTQIEQARITADTAEANLGYTRITSPIDGVVVAVVTEQGQTVASSQAVPTIVKVAQLDQVTVKAQISEGDVTRVRPGLPVYFSILGEPDRRYAATLQAVAPAPASLSSDISSSPSTTSNSPAAIYYSAHFNVPNPEGRLRISMSALVTVVVASARGAVLVPAIALSDRPDTQGLYTVRVEESGPGESMRLAERKVRIGLNNHVQAQVLQGLKPGERVVTSADMSTVRSGGKAF